MQEDRRDDLIRWDEDLAIRDVFRRRPTAAWTTAYALFVAVAVSATAGITSSPMAAAGCATLCLLVLGVVCMATHRGGWSPLWRVLYVPLGFVVYNYVLIGVALAVVGFPFMRARAWEWAQPVAAALASVVAASHAIRQSRLFMPEGVAAVDCEERDTGHEEGSEQSVARERAPMDTVGRFLNSGPLAGVTSGVSRDRLQALASKVTRRGLVLAYLAVVLLMTAYGPMQVTGPSGAKAGLGYGWIWKQGKTGDARWQRPDMARWAMQVVGLSAATGFVWILRRERPE